MLLFKVDVEYNIPKTNGWDIKKDTFIFNTKQDRTDFLNGEVAHDYLDYWVELDTTKYTVTRIYEEEEF